MLRSTLAASVMFLLAVLPGTSYVALAQPTAPAAPAAATPAPVASPYVIQLVPPKPETPPQILHFREPVVFVLVLGKDDATRAKVAVAMAKALGTQLQVPVVPESEWELSDFIAQCRADSNALGAFVVLPPAAGAKKYDYLVVLTDMVNVEFNAMISECPARGANGTSALAAQPATPQIYWAAPTVTGEYGRTVIQFLPFAVLTSVYLAFAPQRLYQNVTNKVFPVHSPIPETGAITSLANTSAATFNASGTSSLQNSIVTSVAAAQLNFGTQSDPNHLTLHAAEDAAHQFAVGLRGYCTNAKRASMPQPAASPAVEPTPFCDWLKPAPSR